MKSEYSKIIEEIPSAKLVAAFVINLLKTYCHLLPGLEPINSIVNVDDGVYGLTLKYQGHQLSLTVKEDAK